MNRLYYKLPLILKNISTSLIALQKKHQKNGAYFKKYLNFLLETSPEEQIRQANEELLIFLDRLKKTSKYYQIPKDLDLKAMPIINKKDVLRNYDSILGGENAFITVKSSGTTGQPLSIPYNIQAYQKEYAFLWYHRSFENITINDRVATFAGHKIADIERKIPPFWVYNFVNNQLIFSSYHFSDKNLKFYLTELNKFKPVFIHGYPSSIYLVAKYILENNLQLDFQVKMIALASESILDFQKVAIESAFGCKVYIWYGNTEYCGQITECKNSCLHVQPYHSLVRFLDKDGRDVSPGEEGRIVGTNFTNTVLPLINYDTKDIVQVSKSQECLCGQKGTIVDFIHGRMEDYILLPDGRRIGRLDHLFKDAKYVRNAQIEQNKMGEIILRIEKEQNYSIAIENLILKEARNRLGKDVEIIFDYVSEIKKNDNGKFNFIIQKLKFETRATI